MSTINICICTCQRVQLLNQCLDSIAECRRPANTLVSVMVIDNDASQSALSLVTDLAATFPIPLRYIAEPRRGIPCARNRAINETHRLGSDYLVFIDDDEWVQTDWLESLYGYCCKVGGDVVVAGCVISELPDNVPPHIRAVYQKKKHTTGGQLSSCATNNVIIPMYVTRDLGLRFDESNPLAGGTDTIFFVEAVSRGVKIVRCAEALVHESVPLSRANLRWLSKRKYRAGITEAWRKRKKGRSKLRIVTSASILIGIELTKCGAVSLVGNKIARTRFWLKACKYAGVVAGTMGVTIDSYGDISS